MTPLVTRPLARLHAVTDRPTVARADFAARAAAIAAAGSPVALHARDRALGGSALAALAARLVALARPAEASVVVSGRADVAAAVGAQGVQLAAIDLAPADARRVLGAGWVGCSVHSRGEAEAAVSEGADYLVVGNVYETATHPGLPGGGLDLVRAVVALGRPVIAIGGVTAARVAELRDAGAYGIAAISALWEATDPASAAVALLEPWAVT